MSEIITIGIFVVKGFDKRIVVPVICGVLILAAFIAWIALRGSGSGENEPDSQAGETASQEELKEELFAMDTVMDITLYRTEKTDRPLRDIFNEMRDRIYQMESEFSVTNPDSEISKLNASSGTGKWMSVSDDVWELLEQAVDISVYTDLVDSILKLQDESDKKTPQVSSESKYAFDPTLYPIVKLWGFTTGEFRVPSAEEIERELEKTGIEKLEWDPSTDKHEVRLNDGVQIDFGACAKGFLSDKLSEIMKAHHVNGILSLGGNVQTVGAKPDGSPFVVGITDPSDGNSIYKMIETRDEAVITSGDYQRYFEQDGKRYHHIMDGRTGAPAESGLSSVTVIGERGLRCDAYATAFFVMGEELTRNYLENMLAGYKVILIRKDGSCWMSEGISVVD